MNAVTKLTQPSDKNPPGRNKGPSEGTSASEGRVGLWKGYEEEELKHLVGFHTGSKGTVSWVKVVETWNSLELPKRTKASLSSKWSDIKSRATVLHLIKEQNDVGLCTTPKIDVSQQQTNVNSIKVVNRAVKSSKGKRPIAIGNVSARLKINLTWGIHVILLKWILYYWFSRRIFF